MGDATTMIHAYDAGPVPQSNTASNGDRESQDGNEQWKSRSNSLLCCFSSSGYYPQHDVPATAQLAHASDWQNNTGELKVYAQGSVAKRGLLGPQRPEHVGRITLVLDLDGVRFTASFVAFEGTCCYPCRAACNRKTALCKLCRVRTRLGHES